MPFNYLLVCYLFSERHRSCSFTEFYWSLCLLPSCHVRVLLLASHSIGRDCSVCGCNRYTEQFIPTSSASDFWLLLRQTGHEQDPSATKSNRREHRSSDDCRAVAPVGPRALYVEVWMHPPGMRKPINRNPSRFSVAIDVVDLSRAERQSTDG